MASRGRNIDSHCGALAPAGLWQLLIGLIIVVLVFAHPVPSHAAEAPPIAFSAARTQGQLLAGHLSWLRDPDGRLTVADIAFGAAHGELEPLPGNLSLGYVPDVAWVYLTVTTTAAVPTRAYLELVPNFLDYMTVYTATAPAVAADFRTYRLGDHMPLAARPLPGLEVTIPLDLAPGKPMVVIARLRQTSGTLILRGALHSETSLGHNQTLLYTFNGLSFGLSSAIALTNLLVWLWLRDRYYAFYAAYTISIALCTFSLSGYSYYFIFQKGGTGNDLFFGLVSSLSLLFGALFNATFLQLRRRNIWLFGLHVAVGAIALSGIGLTLAGRFQLYAPLGLLASVALVGVSTVYGAFLSLSGAPAALPYTASFLVLLIGLSAGSLRAIGTMETSLLTDHSYEIGSLIHVMLMNITLAMRLKHLDEARRASDKALITASRAAEKHALDLVTERTRDLAEAKQRAEAALAAELEAQQMQLRFVDVISHQYRTPLSVISSTIDAIALSLTAWDEANRRRLDRIKRTIAQLLEISDIHLNRSRFGGVLMPRLRPIQVARLMERIVARARNLSNRTPVGFESDAPTLNRVVNVDASLIEIAVLNLVDNAMKFSRGDPQVSIACHSREAMVVITVEDRGIGIPERDRMTVFRKYGRGTNAGDQTGMGLGLAMVSKIVAGHNGTVEMESVEGEGTIIGIALPSYSDAELGPNESGDLTHDEG